MYVLHGRGWEVSVWQCLAGRFVWPFVLMSLSHSLPSFVRSSFVALVVLIPQA